MASSLKAAALLWSASILLSRIIGLLREAVLGRTLGAGQDADLYQASFVLPDFLNYLLAGGALSVVLIPILVRHRNDSRQEALQESFSAIIGAITVAIVLLTAAAFFCLPYFLPFWFPGFDAPAQRRLLEITQIVVLAQVFHVVGGVFSAALQAHDRHAIPAMAPLLYTVCIVIGGLVGGPEAGAMGFAWGVLVGSVLGPFALPAWGVFRLGLWPRSWRLRSHPDLWRYLRASLPIMLGFSIVMMDEWIFKRLASPMGEGAVAQLGYARSLMRVPMGVFGLAMGAASFPRMSRQAAQGDKAGLAQTAGDAVRKVLVLALGAQVLLTVAGQDIAQVIYGQRVLPEQYAAIAENLQWMSVALGAWSTHNLFARIFYAQGRTWVPSLVGSVCMLVFYPVYVLWAQRWGATGLAMAGAAAMSSYVLVLGLWARRSLGESMALASFLPRVFLACALAIAFFVYLDGRVLLAPLSTSLAVHPALSALVRGAIWGAAALLSYALLLWFLRVQELRDLLAILSRRLGRKAAARES